MVFVSFLPSQMTSIVRKLLFTTLFFVVLTHAVGILLPETGFDALWYHLPIVRDMAETHHIQYVPSIPQSNQPRLGELLFLPWFLLLGTMGVKTCTFLLMLVLLFLTYRLATHYMDTTSALAATLLVATFHTVAWQATSAYVDILRTIFEMAILILLSERKAAPRETVRLGIFLTGALSTKLVALLFSPALLAFVFMRRGWKKGIFFFLLIIFVYVAGRFPVGFFSSVSHELITWQVFFRSIKSFFLLPFELSFHAESYTTPLFLFVVPFVFIQRHWVWRIYKHEIIFLLLSFLTWVFVVPISVRYDLSAIILAAILCVSVILRTAARYPYVRGIFLCVLGCSILLNMSVRIGVVVRALPFLLGKQTEQQYICQFDHGIVRGPLETWYKPLSCDAVQ